MSQEPVIKVRLDEHWGEPMVPGGQSRVRLPQFVIMIQDFGNPEVWHWSGYVGEHDGAHVNLLASIYTPLQVEEIKQKVIEAKKAKGLEHTVSHVAQIKPLSDNEFEVVKETANTTANDVV